MSIIYQTFEKDTFAYQKINEISRYIEKKCLTYELDLSKYNIYIGFSYGRSKGLELTYSNKKYAKKINTLADNLINKGYLVRYFGNMPSKYDLLLKLGYIDGDSKEIVMINSKIYDIADEILKIFILSDLGHYMKSSKINNI